MHARKIIQDLLLKKCPSMHAKRRQCVAKLVEAGRIGGLGLLKLSRAMARETSLRSRIKCCDRLLSNRHLNEERGQIFAALNECVLPAQGRIGIIIDWSNLLADGSAQLLRAAAMVKGRAFVLYEEVHRGKDSGSPVVHRQFLKTLRTLLPPNCNPILVTDAGFRSTWFKIATELKYAWVGRIRNIDKVCAHGSTEWKGCKTLYPRATARPSKLGWYSYVRSNPTPCQLVTLRKPSRGRHCKTAFGKQARSIKSLRNRATQMEPWLLAVSPELAALNAKEIASLYAGRMQIEQTFRDVKNSQWGMGLSQSQTRKHERLGILLLIGALVSYTLWIVGLAARQSGYWIGYGSRKNAPTTVSILTLARSWLAENNAPLTRRQLENALLELRSMVVRVKI
jgi:hypothetical protein